MQFKDCFILSGIISLHLASLICRVERGATTWAGPGPPVSPNNEPLVKFTASENCYLDVRLCLVGKQML